MIEGGRGWLDPLVDSGFVAFAVLSVLFVMVESADFIPGTKIALAVAAVLTLVALTAVMIGVPRRR